MKTIAMYCMLVCFIVPHAYAQARMNTELGDDWYKEVLLQAGYRMDTASLIRALKDKNQSVADSAAALLPTLSRSKEVVDALDAAVSDPREVVAWYAAMSLVKLGATGWVQKAIARLPNLTMAPVQLHLSAVLAEAGHADGWHYLTDAILEGKHAKLALYLVDKFEGKTDATHKRIVVMDELTALEGKASEEIRPLITEKIHHLRRASKPR